MQQFYMVKISVLGCGCQILFLFVLFCLPVCLFIWINIFQYPETSFLIRNTATVSLQIKYLCNMINTHSIPTQERKFCIYICLFCLSCYCGYSRSNDAGRRFYVAKKHVGCDRDAGWLAMVVNNGDCDWEKTCGDKTCFLYSKQQTAAVWQDAEGECLKIL